MPTRFFISYRREDSAGHAGRIHDRLAGEFGRDLIFMDVDAIPLGANFAKVLAEEVGKCDILLAIIGPTWLASVDEQGNRRLDSDRDFVRIEIAAALARNIPVIPVFIENTRTPNSSNLPDDLKELSLRNGINIRHASFHDDMNKLIRRLRQEPSHSRAPLDFPFGLTLDSPEVHDLIAKLGEPSERRTVRGEVLDHVVKAAGVRLEFRDKVLMGVFLYGGGYEGYGQYRGALPKGLTFDDVRSTVELKCGPPTDTGGGYTDVWALYDSCIVVYRSKTKSDMTSRIGYVALFPDHRRYWT